MKRNLGLTLSELLVALSVLTLIGVMFFWTMTGFVAQSHQGAQRLEMQQQVREAHRRTERILRSAVPPSEIQTALYSPAVGATGNEVIFCSTSELMDPSVPFDPRNPVYKLFRISQSTDHLMLESIYGPETPRDLGRLIDQFEVERLSDTALTVRIVGVTSIRGAGGQRRNQTHEVESSIQLPF